MRKIVLWMSVSIDGFFEGPDRDISWHLVDEELHSHFNDELRRMGAFLGGRVTYELMAAFWPTADADPDAAAPVREFASIWRDMPKIVYSRTLAHADWNTTIRRDVVVEEIRALMAEPGGDLVVGGADLAATFRRLDLIDEYRLYVHPVLLGRGNPLFRDPLFRDADARSSLRLVETRMFGNGVVLLRYDRPVTSGADGSAIDVQTVS
jgi:dihydrofolate reductase